ncbi:MAG: bifunctional oligoribonuclease/PAP phosphatase NrnA [Candidatus Saganbacteria bacterium]|nr:bifunctional oligoribonuclease/PAP phosphatase NrnA [Candidatus Saganbacteria bacterium]
MKKIIEAINNHSNFLVCLHVDPDGDTIGSASALSSILKKLGKKVSIYSRDKIPEIYGFLKNIDQIKSSLVPEDRFDAVIAVDCGDIKRIAVGDKIRQHSDLLINIDHHEDNKKFGDLNLVKKCSSTGEIIYKIAKKMGVGLDPDIAAAIYAAIITDTGCFKYDNTNAKIFSIAKDLADNGADPHGIAFKIYESKTRSEIKILGFALEKMESTADGKISWIILTNEDIKKCGANSEEVSGIADHLRSLKDTDIAVFLKETESGTVKVNFRSKTKNVQRIAKEFGGGGHVRASGAVLKMEINKAKDSILETVKSLWTQL